MAYRWKVVLKGRTSDFKIIKGEFRVSDFLLLEEDDRFYLGGPRFDHINTNQEIYEEAKGLIADINVCFIFSRSNFAAIDLGDFIEERRTDGSNAIHTLAFVRSNPSTSATSTTKNIQFSAVSLPPPPLPSFPEIVIKAFSLNDNFREAVKSFNAEPKNWKDLYIAYESVLRGLSPSKKDYKTIVKLNWANGDELKRFHRTANYHRHGLPRDPIEGVAPLPLDDAVELVQRLLAEWAKMLSR